MELIRDNKALLASCVFELVRDYKDYLFLNKKTSNKFPFSDIINEDTRSLLSDYNDINPKEGRNICFLNFFFNGFINVFGRILPETLESGNTRILIGFLKEKAEKLLVETQKHYSPVLLLLADAIITDEANESDHKKAKKSQMDADKLAKDIIKYYQSFNASIKITEIVIKDDRYIFTVKPLPGTRKQSIFKFASEVQMFLDKAWFSPVEDIENQTVKIVISDKELGDNSLLKILESPLFSDSKWKIPYAMGYDTMGNIFVDDFADFYHLLVGGTSGFGKSSALFSLLMSIIYKQYIKKVDHVNLLIIDVGHSGFDLFNKTPYMSYPVITDLKTAVAVIMLLHNELERRIFLRENNKAEFDKLPHIVCVIDEFPSFIEDVIKANLLDAEIISDILKRSRKFHINIVLSAIDPTKEEMQCNISPISARIAFRCAQPYNSRVILGRYSDASSIVGVGNMYFVSGHHQGLKFLRGAFMPPTIEDAKKLNVDFSIEKMLNNMNFGDYRENKYKFKITEEDLTQVPIEDKNKSPTASKRTDCYEEKSNKKLAEYILEALETGTVANYKMQKKCNIGNNAANDILKRWNECNFITQKDGRNKGWTALPVVFSEIPAEAIDFLKKYCTGYTDEEVIAALNKRAVSSQSQPEVDEPLTLEFATTAESISIPAQEVYSASPESINFQTLSNENPQNQHKARRRKKRRK